MGNLYILSAILGANCKMRVDKTIIFLCIIALSLTLIAIKVNFFSENSEIPFTGLATAGNNTLGKVNITILTGVVINFTTDTINWGSGRVDAGANNATLDTSGRTPETKMLNGNWTGGYTNETNGLILENIGNINAALHIKTASNATTFIGGVNPLYQFNITNNETGSCVNATGFNLGEYYDVNATSGDGTLVCDVLNSDNSADTIRLDILLRIPGVSNTGSLEDQITATAYAAAE